MILAARTVDTPIGSIVIIANERAVLGVEFESARDRRAALARHLERYLGPYALREHEDPAGAATRLARYFRGHREALDDQGVEIHGTEFQCRVWRALREIRAGTTWSYTQLAERIGQPTARRAVGAANGANRIALFVPCHRVIAADRSPWGYGGGLDRKRRLLVHEGALFAEPRARAVPVSSAA